MRNLLTCLLPLCLLLAAACTLDSVETEGDVIAFPPPEGEEIVEDLGPADGAEIPHSYCDTSSSCCYLGQEYVKQGSSACKYVCTINGDLCYGEQTSLCDKYDCGAYGVQYYNCSFVQCTIGSTQAP